MEKYQQKLKELEEFKKNGQISFKEYNKQRKKLEREKPISKFSKIVLLCFFTILGLITVVGISNAPEKPPEPPKEPLVNQVNEAINKLGEDMRIELASTRPGGYRGDMVSVEPAIGNNSVKVNVSTYFKDSGDGIDGGQGIAHRILSNICLDVPELKSLYVVSGHGLESKSVYRSQIPLCN